MAGVSGAGMGRLMGFGFLFGARDDGATRTASEVRENIEGINTAAERSGGRAANGLRRLNAVIGALQLGRLNQIGGALSNIASRAGAMSDVATSSVESWGAQAGLSFRQATAGAGTFRAELDALRGPIMGTARALDMDVGSLTRLNRGILTAGTSLDELGLSQRDVAGALQAGIIDAEGFGQSIREMTHNLGLSGEEVGGLLDEFTALGESVGEGEAFVRGIPNMLEGIREGMSEFPALRRNSRQLITSLGRLARGMQQVSGSTPEEALGATNQVFQQLLGSRRNLRDLFSGMGSDFDDLATQLGIGGAGIGGALEMILSDPATFAVRAAELFERSGGAGTVMGDRLTAVLSRMGPQFVRLVDGSEESRAALQAMGAELGNVSGAFGRMAQSGSGSARTFAENMERLRDNFSNSINTMLNRTRTARGEMRFDAAVLRAQRDAYRNLTERVQGYADSQGALGTVTRLLLGSRRGGLVGLSVQLQRELQQFPALQRAVREYLPVLGEFGSGALEAGQQVAPMLVAMRALNIQIPLLGGAMRLLLNPITLIAGGIYLLWRYWDRIEPMIERGSVLFRDFSRQLVENAKGFDWAKLGRQIVDGIIMAFGVVGDMEGTNETTRAIAEGLRNVFTAAGMAISGVASGLWDRVTEWITEPEGGWNRFRRAGAVAGVALGAALFTPMRGPMLTAARATFGFIGRGVARMAAAIPNMMGGIRSAFGAMRFGASFAGGGAARTLTGGALRVALRAIPGIGVILGVLFDLPRIIQSFRTEGITSGIEQIFHSVLNGVLLGIPRILQRFTGFDLVGLIFEATGFTNFMDAVRSGDVVRIVSEGLWNLFSGVFANIPNIIRTALSRAVGTDVIGELFGNVSEVVRDVWSIFTEFFNAIRGDWDAIAAPIWDSMVLAFQTIYETGSEVFGDIRAIFVDLWEDTFRPILRDIQQAFREVFEQNILPMVRGVWRDIEQWFRRYWNDSIIPGLEAGVQNIARGFLWMSETGASAFGRAATFIINRIFDITGAIVSMRERWEWFRDTLTTSSRYVGEVLQGALTVPFMRANQAITSIVHEIQNAFDVLRLSVVDMVEGMVDAIGRVIRNMPGGELLASQFQPAIDAIGEYRRQQENEVTRRRQDRQREARAQDQELQERISRIRDAEDVARSTYESGRDRVAAAEAENQRNRRRALAGVEQMTESVSAASLVAAGQFAELGSAEGRAQARSRRAEERRREARALIESLGGVSGLSTRERRVIAAAVNQAAEQGRAIDATDVMQRVEAVQGRGAARQEAVGRVLQGLGGDGGESTTPRSSSGRRRGRAQAAHAQRQMSRERQQQAATQELARELVIASFGPEAVRQLSQALTIQVRGGGLRAPQPVSGQD